MHMLSEPTTVGIDNERNLNLKRFKEIQNKIRANAVDANGN